MNGQHAQTELKTWPKCWDYHFAHPQNNLEPTKEDMTRGNTTPRRCKSTKSLRTQPKEHKPEKVTRILFLEVGLECTLFLYSEIQTDFTEQDSIHWCWLAHPIQPAATSKEENKQQQTTTPWRLLLSIDRSIATTMR